jgi:hypothetical protein
MVLFLSWFYFIHFWVYLFVFCCFVLIYTVSVTWQLKNLCKYCCVQRARWQTIRRRKTQAIIRWCLFLIYFMHAPLPMQYFMLWLFSFHFPHVITYVHLFVCLFALFTLHLLHFIHLLAVPGHALLWLSPIPSHPVPSHPIPSRPVPSHPVPSRPIPSRPIPYIKTFGDCFRLHRFLSR